MGCQRKEKSVKCVDIKHNNCHREWCDLIWVNGLAWMYLAAMGSMCHTEGFDHFSSVKEGRVGFQQVVAHNTTQGKQALWEIIYVAVWIGEICKWSISRRLWFSGMRTMLKNEQKTQSFIQANQCCRDDGVSLWRMDHPLLRYMRGFDSWWD